MGSRALRAASVVTGWFGWLSPARTPSLPGQ